MPAAAPLQGLARLKQRYSFLLAVDEAHATLVCGERGGGAAEMLGVADDVDLHVGTLSKAFGALGGFVACSSAFKRYLSNKGRSVVYSTALPLPVVAAALAAIEVRCCSSLCAGAGSSWPGCWAQLRTAWHAAAVGSH